MKMLKPMLAAKAGCLNNIRLPVLCSPKLDGIRCIILDGVAYSRNMKPIPNQYVQFKASEYKGLDGELICGPPTAKDAFRRTTSAVMSQYSADEQNIKFHVFDNVVSPTMLLEPFEFRLSQLDYLDEDDWVQQVEHEWAHSVEHLEQLEQMYLSQGYEGMMVRDPKGHYKQGRSTELEGWLLKVKRFEDAEALVIDVEEQLHNANEATKDALGRTKRSSHKANKTRTGKLGALVCRLPNGVEFNIGTGFDDALRAHLWRTREHLVGKYVKFKYFPTGAKDRPRFPVFIGFRHEDDV